MIDKDAFCEKITENEKAMYYLAFSVVKNDADAAEVLSESIYRAYKNLDTLKSVKSFKPWILRIVHNTAVEIIRKDSRVIPIQEVEASQAVPVKDDTSIALRSAVESLKQPYRTVVVLYYYENLSVGQIAEVTNSTAIAVKQQLSRARKMLRELLKEDFKNE